jgi:hypothetical protein
MKMQSAIYTGNLYYAASCEAIEIKEARHMNLNYEYSIA